MGEKEPDGKPQSIKLKINELGQLFQNLQSHFLSAFKTKPTELEGIAAD